MFSSGKIQKPKIGSGKNATNAPGTVDWLGHDSSNENTFKFKGFKANDAGVNIYGGVPTNDNPFEFNQENVAKQAKGTKATKLKNT